MTFVQRPIDIVAILGDRRLRRAAREHRHPDGYQVHANITKGGAPSWDAAEIRVWGVSES